MTDSPVIAVGRMLKPKHGEPRVHSRIIVHQARQKLDSHRITVTERLLEPGTGRYERRVLWQTGGDPGTKALTIVA